MSKNSKQHDDGLITYHDVVEILEAVEAFQWCDFIDIEVGDFRLKVARWSDGSARSVNAEPNERLNERLVRQREVGELVTPKPTNGSAAEPDTADPASAPPSNKQRSSEDGTEPGGQKVIPSPSIGIFYHAPSPGAAPYVEVGKNVIKGDIIGLIEVMKLFTDITSPVTGIVREIFVDNNTLVEHGQSLVAIDMRRAGSEGDQ